MTGRSLKFGWTVVVGIIGLMAGSSLLAQVGSPSGPTNPPLRPPVVTVFATDPVADETGTNSGTFTIWRSDGTNSPLLVFYQLGGTATNGVDYQTLLNTVVIPEGARSATVVVTPIDDMNDESNQVETVVLQLVPSPIMAPITPYLVGSPSTATVYILEGIGNLPPRVNIRSPINGVFTAPANIILVAEARDLDGTIATVEFFEGTNSLGFGTNLLMASSSPNLYALIWSNVLAGTYAVTAKATDNGGATSVSAPVRIIVQPLPVLPVVNIVATDPIATEIPPVPPGMGMPQRYDPAVFTVTRTGDTILPLKVYYRIGGTAINGFDYARLPGVVTIPAGSISNNITVSPIDDFLPNEGTQTVVLTLQAPICADIIPPPPGCYSVGPSNEATAYILEDDDTVTNNLPPSVRLVKPVNGQLFLAPANVAVSVDTVDADGYVNHVEVFAGTKKIAEETRMFLVPPPAGQHIVYDFVWTNPPPDRYVLTATATDDQGASSTSAPVVIMVVTNLPPITNPPPVVSIVATDPIASEGLILWANNGLVGVPPWTAAWGTNMVPPGGVIWTTNLGTNFCWRTNIVGTNILIGTNTATFRVRRTDGTNADLMVYYAISGTASNGVDYATLPGSVTIPAGKRYADIIVVPLEDKLVEGIETVVLTLTLPPPLSTTDTNPPPYRIGLPRRAAAIIIDNDFPLPFCHRLPDQVFNVNRWAPNGMWYRIELSSDLLDWTPVCTNIVVDGAIHFVDPDASGQPMRYYRALPELNPPLEP